MTARTMSTGCCWTADSDRAERTDLLAGTDQPAFSFQRGVSGFIAAAEPRVERTELAWPEDEPDAWGTEPAGPLAVPEGSTCLLYTSPSPRD